MLHLVYLFLAVCKTPADVLAKSAWFRRLGVLRGGAHLALREAEAGSEVFVNSLSHHRTRPIVQVVQIHSD